MPSLKEIKTRIASVNSTRKITSAMKMVASSKLHHAQVMIENMLPYETMLEHILKTFLASEADASNVFTITVSNFAVSIVRNCTGNIRKRKGKKAFDNSSATLVEKTSLSRTL